MSLAEISDLDKERYLSEKGNIHLRGIQALVRLPFDNLRLLKEIHPDKKFGYFVSGYPGSPLGGLDITFDSIKPLLKEWNIFHIPGGNEEGAATYMAGASEYTLYGDPRFDGLIGTWYGKAPGVRRIKDVADHMQITGLDEFCAGYFMSGDDHSAKSSSTPTSTEWEYYSVNVPTAYPGNPEEVLSLGKRAMLASMISGLHTNLKIETFIADGSSNFNLNPDENKELLEAYNEIKEDTKEYRRFFNTVLLKQRLHENECELYNSKLPMFESLIDRLGFNEWKNQGKNKKVGIIAAGKSYYDTSEALKRLDITNEIEIYKPGILWPLDVEFVKKFVEGKEEVIIVEEKKPFFEKHIKEELYNESHRPKIFGKSLFPHELNFDADLIESTLRGFLSQKEEFKGIEQSAIDLLGSDPYESLTIPRAPGFCPGCQYPTALQNLGKDALTGIGCQTMSIIERVPELRSIGFPQMGGEGRKFVGAAPFLEEKHMFQYCGDGTWEHSARLNTAHIKGAIDILNRDYGINVNQTIEVVFNGAIAMTGGQKPVGNQNPESIISQVVNEGLENVVLVAENPRQFKYMRRKYGIEVYDKSEIKEVKDYLSQTKGLSFLLHVQQCALEKKKNRKSRNK